MSGERDEIYALLPWYAAGTLSAEDAARVKSAVAADPGLARTLAQIRDERDQTIAVNEAILPSSHSGLDPLMSAVEAEAPRTGTPARSPVAWLLRQIDAVAPQTVALAGVAALLVIVVQGGLLTSVMLREGATPPVIIIDKPDEPMGLLPPDESGGVLAVRFVGGATMETIVNLLVELDARVIWGPSGDGLYVIQLKSMTAEAALERLGRETALVLDASEL